VSGRASIGGLAADTRGNIIVTGWFSGELELADRTLTQSHGNAMYALALDGAGKTLWTLRPESTAPSYGHASAAGATGIYLAGSFEHELRLGQARLQAASPDGFVVSLTPTGQVRWVRQLGGSGAVRVRALAVAPSGALIVGGGFDDILTLSNEISLTSNGLQDGFVAVFAPDGTARWARQFGGDRPDVVAAVAAHGPSGVLAAGSFHRAVAIGEEQLSATGERADAFMAALDLNSGAPLWARRYGGPGNDAVYAISSGEDGQIVAAGNFDGVGLFGAAPLEAEGGTDVFIASYAADGRHLWSSRLGGAGRDDAYAATRAGATIVVAGSFSSRMQVADTQLVSRGDSDAFVAAYSLTGEPLWVRQLGGAGQDHLTAATPSPLGGLVMAGSFAAQAHFGDHALAARNTRALAVLKIAL
jgi:hypothetical protein